MKKKAALLGGCLLAFAMQGNVWAESVQIIGENEAVSEMGETTELSSLLLKPESMEVCKAEDDHYAELYVNLLVQNLGHEDRALRNELTANLSFMSRYEFKMDLDSFVFPTATWQSAEDYVLDPLCEMLVVYHTQIPKAVVERDGELLMTVTCGEESAEFSLEISEMGELQEKRAAMDIPANALEWNGHKYAMYYGNEEGLATWQEARDFCESLGGHLATITSAAENSAIYNFVNNYWKEEMLFFGFSDWQEEGVWVWENGEESDYTNWASGEPNDQNGQDYAQIYWEGTWDDDDFSYSKFICEWDCYEIEE
ncbi:MAG: C-type lectin domain-containing protein [Eubacteriales bacterium]|nr:C-type lectin domain-containing protein [Eubacteriales bacterium]